MPHTLILLSPLTKGSGNYCTISRIKNQLKRHNYECHLRDPSDLSQPEVFSQVVDTDNIGVLIGIHALRTGAFMKDSNLPYILILGGTDIHVFCNDPVSMQIMTDAVYKARFVVCFSGANKNRALKLWPELDSSRIRVISQAVETSPSKFDLLNYLGHYAPHLECFRDGGERPCIFLLVAGIRRVKNPMYLIKTFQEWHAKDKRIVFLIIGPKLDEAYVRDTLEVAIQRQPGVVFIPGLCAEDVHSIMTQAFALVNSSDSEGMCLAILEAMQLGLPVIARDIPANSSIIEDGTTGLLFDSPQTFLQKAEHLMDNENLRKSLVTSARGYVHRYHSTDIEQRAYVDLVKQCIQELQGELPVNSMDLDLHLSNGNSC